MVHTMVSNMDPPLQPGESVYELACGTGAALSFLRDYLHAGVVGGVDASQNAIAYARSSLPEHASRFAVQNMTAPNSAVAAGAFDHTIAIGGLAMYLGRRDMMRAITEAVRVTKPGGSLLLSHFIEELGAPRGQIVEPVPKDFWPSALATLGLERIRIRPVPHHSQGDRYYITAVKRGPAGLNAHRRKRLMEAGGDGLSGQDLSLQHARHIAVDEHVVAGMDTCIRDLALKLRSALEDAKIWYTLDAGSLVAALRNGRRGPWDDDLDLRVSAHDWAKLEAVAAKGGHEITWTAPDPKIEWWWQATIFCGVGSIAADVVRADIATDCGPGVEDCIRWANTQRAFEEPLAHVSFEGLSLPIPALKLAQELAAKYCDGRCDVPDTRRYLWAMFAERPLVVTPSDRLRRLREEP